MKTAELETAAGETAESISAKAYSRLEKMIVTLELAPGRVTTERALIEKLSLGRTPVREAIQRLAWEGLVTVRPRAGLEIAPLHAGDWLKVLDARRGIEVILAREAARYATPEILARLQATALAMHDAVVTSNVVGYIEADRSLDEAVALAADNHFAARLVTPLQSHSRRFWFRFQSGTGLAEVAGNRVTQIRAILERDQNAAAAEADRLMALLRLHAQAAAMR